MTTNEYQSLAARTINKSLPFEDKRSHSLYGMASELGEIMSHYQKKFQGHSLDHKKIREELGDLMWFIAEFCTANGWHLDDVCTGNIYKLYGRYPDGFDPERSLHREETP